MDGYRERVAAALEAADTDCHTGCQPDPDRLADAVLDVRDEELERLRQQLVSKEATRQAGLDVIRLQNEREERSQAAIARVRALHAENHRGWCEHCSELTEAPHGPVSWPCDTVKALDSEGEGSQ